MSGSDGQGALKKPVPKKQMHTTEVQNIEIKWIQLLDYLDANTEQLRRKRIAFGVEGILISTYGRRFRDKNEIKGHIRRPFSQEIIDWFAQHGDTLILWTAKTRERATEQLASAKLNTPKVRIVDHLEYLATGGKERLEAYDVVKMPGDVLRSKDVDPNHIKLPSVLDVNYLVDKRIHQLYAPGFDEDQNGYIPIKTFSPAHADDFPDNNDLANAMTAIINQLSGPPTVDTYR